MDSKHAYVAPDDQVSLCKDPEIARFVGKKIKDIRVSKSRTLFLIFEDRTVMGIDNPSDQLHLGNEAVF
jgi:hypothetical protein